MEDNVTFLQDIHEDTGDILFEKDQCCAVLDEDAEFYYIEIQPKTNQVTKFQKKLEGKLFIFN